jgi:hypothetical protein
MSERRLGVLLIGLGGLGGTVLEFLTRSPAVGRITGADLNRAKGLARTNLARVSRLAEGRQPELDFVPIDLVDVAGAAETIARVRPDVILSTASLQTWWLTGLLPPEATRPLRPVKFGAWLPVHLALTLDLMRAVRLAAFDGPVLTAPFPDVVNPVLAGLGLAPTCGIGNVDEIVPKVQWLAASRLGVPLASVHVSLVAHHALEPLVFGEVGDVPPHYLRIEHDGTDVTAAVGGEDLLLSPYPLPSGPAWHFLTAACATRLVEGLAGGHPIRRHAPAPGGLPGGYPVDVCAGAIRVAPVPGLTLPEAIAINARAHPFDGIERIEPDGTAIIGEASASALHETLGYDCRRLPPGDARPRATELLARFREYARGFGLDVDRIARAVT